MCSGARRTARRNSLPTQIPPRCDCTAMLHAAAEPSATWPELYTHMPAACCLLPRSPSSWHPHQVSRPSPPPPPLAPSAPAQLTRRATPTPWPPQHLTWQSPRTLQGALLLAGLWPWRAQSLRWCCDAAGCLPQCYVMSSQHRSLWHVMPQWVVLALCSALGAFLIVAFAHHSMPPHARLYSTHVESKVDWVCGTVVGQRLRQVRRESMHRAAAVCAPCRAAAAALREAVPCERGAASCCSGFCSPAHLVWPGSRINEWCRLQGAPGWCLVGSNARACALSACCKALLSSCVAQLAPAVCLYATCRPCTFLCRWPFMANSRFVGGTGAGVVSWVGLKLGHYAGSTCRQSFAG